MYHGHRPNTSRSGPAARCGSFPFLKKKQVYTHSWGLGSIQTRFQEGRFLPWGDLWRPELIEPFMARPATRGTGIFAECVRFLQLGFLIVAQYPASTYQPDDEQEAYGRSKGEPVCFVMHWAILSLGQVGFLSL